MVPLRLDERLQTAADLFPACAYGADIGADHGRLSCYLLEKGICRRMCVADISVESLKKADLLLHQRGLEDRADIMAGSGLTVLTQPAQAVAILGMGGHTMAEILKEGEDRLQGASLILSAHTEMELVRKTLGEIGYRITEERIAFSAARYYVLLLAGAGKEEITEKQCFLGPRLMEGCVPHYPEFLAWKIRMAEPKRTETAALHRQWLKEEEERVRNC